MLSFTVQVAGQEQIQSALDKIPLRDWSEWWAQATAILSQIVANQFASEGGRGAHGQWAPLSPDYALRKAHRYPGARILQASGRLWRALVTHSNDTLDERWPARLRWGVSLPYALYHQLGYATRLGKGKPKPGGLSSVPARRIFDFQEPDDKAMLQRSAGRWFETQCRRLGFVVLGSTAEPAEARLPGAAESAPSAVLPLGIMFGEAFAPA